MMQLEINPFFRDYFEPLDYGQEQALRRSLLAGVTKEPLFYWVNPETGKDELLEGHHRYNLAKTLRLEMEIEKKEFASAVEAELFIIRHQTTRRNLHPFDRERLVKRAVELQMKVEGKTKTEAVKDIAAGMGISEATAWRDVREKNPVELFKEAKAQLEQVLTREKNKAVAAFKKEVIRDELDEDAATDQWQTIEAEINERHQDRIDEVEALGIAAQQAVEENPGLKNAGHKRPVKKSKQALAQKKRDLKAYEGLLKKIQSLRLDVTFDNRLILPRFAETYASIEVIRAEFPKPKARFGR